VGPAVIALVVLALIFVAVLAYRHDRKRRRLLSAWAHARGFRLYETSQRGWDERYPGLSLFGRGRSRHTARHLEGEVDGRRVRCLDYRFTTGSGKNRRNHRFGVVVLDAGTPVIPLCIRSEHIFDKMGEFFGHDDLDFESAEFSRRFHVSSADRRWAYDVIHQRTMDYLLGAPPGTVEFGFAEVAVYRRGALAGHDCQDMLQMARRMLDLVPPDVLAQIKGEPH